MANHWRAAAAGSDGADGDEDWQQQEQQLLPAVPEGPEEQAVGGGADAVDQDSQAGRDALMEREQLLAVLAVHKLKELLSHPVAPEQWFCCDL
jgi:hypothetical protein